MEAPEYYYYCPSADKASAASAAGEQFVVDDLLDFSNAETVSGAGFFDNAAANSADSSVVTVSVAVDSCNSSVCGDNGGNNNNNNNNNNHPINGPVCLNSFYGGTRSFGGGECNLSGELYVPCDDLAELEWLSNFVEDSFSAKQPSLFLPAAAAHPSKPGSSSVNIPTHHGPPPPPDSSSVFLPDPSHLPSKSRSKRPRAIPYDWTTRLLHLTVTATTESPPRASSSKRESGVTTGTGTGGPEAAPRRCLHCAAEKTPQWRTGPLGPKTLCNACGVRYKSGRLVPEYRPAASPTFVSTKHSNSHRKVIELRRQKDIQRVHPHPHPHHHPQFIGPSPIYGGGGNGNGGDHEYLIGVPGFRHMI